MFKTIILAVISYRGETWSLTSREEHRLGVFETRVLRSIFRPKGEEAMTGRRKLHNEDLHSSYSYVIRVIKSRRAS
jgi:hypothetical protein